MSSKILDAVVRIKNKEIKHIKVSEWSGRCLGEVLDNELSVRVIITKKKTRQGSRRDKEKGRSEGGERRD